jgi:hypothetical protein
MAGTNAGESLRIAGLSETVRGQKTLLCGAPTRRRGSHRFSPNRCGMRTLGEHRRTMLTRRQIRIAPCGAPPPRMFRGDVLQPLRDYRAETMAHVLFEK